MVGRWTKGLLHLLVGGACAALVVWLVFGFSQTVTHTEGPVRAAMAVVVLLTVVVVGALLLAPPVRPAEVALAGALLEVSLDEPADTTSWEARARGLLWALAVVVLGGVSLLALLWCLPQGVWMAVAAFAPGAREDLPGALSGTPAPVLLLVGVLVAALGVVVQPVLVALLRTLAPVVLGPTGADLLAREEERRRELLRANALARELHDSVGHALTAIGVQAEAGVRVAGQDPDFARAALERIVETTRRAVDELDEVLGTLRGTAADPDAPADHPRGAAGLDGVVDLLGEAGPRGAGAVTVDAAGGVGPTAARTAYRVVQEALTNARRHGTGGLRGRVAVEDGTLRVRLDNPAAGAAPGPTGGRGLVGMRERVELAGGALEAGPVEIDGARWWRVEARLPAREDGT